MKTYTKLLSGLLSALLLLVGLAGCQDYDIPVANTSLSYPAGEMALGGGTYTSARPTVRSFSTPRFTISGITHNGQPTGTSLAIIDNATGVISITPSSEFTALGNYLVSVRVTDADGITDYADAFKLVVKGMLFDKGVTTKGQSKTFLPKETFLVQQQGNVFSLVIPENDVNGDYTHFSIDSLTSAITVDAQMEAGVYPVSIRAKNRTNPNGVVFEEALSVVVESKPYDLKYTPNEVTLMVKEGHTSPTPTVRAATEAEGTEVSYSLLDNFEVFTIDAKTGAISLPKGLILATQNIKTYKLQVRVSNSLGNASFPDIYTVNIDPTKKADPITNLVYPDAFPVSLKPGQAWTSGVPVATGSTLDLVYSLEDAPEGITIDALTGVITMAANHRLPLKTDNKLTVNAINIAMDAPYQAQVGNFSVSMPEPLWAIKYNTIYSNTATTDSGVDNMDRYSFSAHIQNNQSTDKTATTPVVRNAFGRTYDGGLKEAVDFSCSNASNTWAGNISQNNDWIVSSEIALPEASSTFLVPYIMFELNAQYAKEANLIYEVWAVEINTTNVYTKGEQAQDSKGMDAKPSDLPWVILATNDKTNDAVPAKIVSGASLAGTPLANAVDVSQFGGKKMRFALRCWNPSDDRANNGRTYRTFNLRVQQNLPQE